MKATGAEVRRAEEGGASEAGEDQTCGMCRPLRFGTVLRVTGSHWDTFSRHIVGSARVKSV